MKKNTKKAKTTTTASRVTTSSETERVKSFLSQGGYIVVVDTAFKTQREADKMIKNLHKALGIDGGFTSFKVKVEGV